MKFFDCKWKLFKLFNIVDLCIIVFVVSAAVGAYAFLKTNVDKSSTNEKTYLVTLEIKRAEKDFCETIQPDREVFDRVQNKPIGTLLDVRYNEIIEHNISILDASMQEVLVPDLYDIEIDMQINSKEDVYIGKYMSVKTKDFTGAGNLIKVEKLENN